MRGDERLQLADDARMMSQCEIGVDPIVNYLGPKFLQPDDLCMCERLMP